MRCVLAPSVVVLVVLLAACGKQPADNLADALAADPVRLKALRAQCAADRQATGEDACRAAAEAFVEFLFTTEAQQVFAKYGLRSVDPEVAKATAAQYPPVEDLFTIQEFGGWSEATPKIFGEDGVYSKAVSQVQRLGAQ